MRSSPTRRTPTPRALLADTFDRLGRGAENGTWRNFFLTGSLELRQGRQALELTTTSPEMVAALTVEQLFDSMAVRINGPKAWSERITIDWSFTDLDERYRMTLSNGALIHAPRVPEGKADLSLSLTKPQFLGLLAGQGMDGIDVTGDPSVFARLAGFLDTPDPLFPLVTP